MNLHLMVFNGRINMEGMINWLKNIKHLFKYFNSDSKTVLVGGIETKKVLLQGGSINRPIGEGLVSTR